MPAPSYVLPPWLAQRAAPNPAEVYIDSLRQGAQLAQENKALEQRRELAEMELQARQAAQAAEDQRKQTEIEYEHALRQEQLGLERQKLEEAKALTDQKIQESARRFAAQQRVQQAIASGVSPEQAMFNEGANLDMPAGDFAAVARLLHGQQAAKPNIQETPYGPMLQTGSGPGAGFKPIAQAPSNVAAPQAREVPDESGAPSGLLSVTDQAGRQHFYPRRPPPKSSKDDAAKEAAKRAAALNRTQRRDLERILEVPALFQSRLSAFLATHKKMSQEDATAALTEEIQSQIKKLDEDYARGPGGPAAPIKFDRATGKFIKSSASVDAGAQSEDLTEAEPTEEEEEPETEEA